MCSIQKVIRVFFVSHYRLCRTKKKAQGEGNATIISNLLPFLEYELHTQLMNKLKLRGMNALFGLRIQISVGETMMLGLAVSVQLQMCILCILLNMTVYAAVFMLIYVVCWL